MLKELTVFTSVRTSTLVLVLLVLFTASGKTEAQSAGQYELVDVIKIKMLIDECSENTEISEVLETYMEQLEHLDYSDVQQYSFAKNDEITIFVLKSLHLVTRSSSGCRELQIAFSETLATVKENLEKSPNSKSDDNACSPTYQWRSCKVRARIGLNLRKIPGVVNDYTRLDAFENGEEVKATCTFGNWALVFGKVHDTARETYGWSDRKYLECEPELGQPSSNWSG